jgi:hypothetical protein
VRIALEVQHRVDHVLEHSGTGQGALLGHVADEHEAHTGALGRARQLRGALAHLRHGSGRGLQVSRVQGLDRVDHRDLRPLLLDRGEDAIEGDLGHQPHPLALDADPARPQGDLRRRLLATDVQHRHPRRHRRQRLQQQCRLADPGIPSDQHDTARNEAAPQHAVEFLEAG